MKNLLEMIQTALGALLGVQSKKHLAKNEKRDSIVPFIIVGLLSASALVISIALVVETLLNASQ